MSIEIVGLTPRGEALSHSVRHSNDIGWRVIYFLKKLGGRSTFDRICQMCFGGDAGQTRSVITNLKAKGIVTGD